MGIIIRGEREEIGREVGDITLCDLKEIAQEYTLGKIMRYSVDNMAYVAAYCRKLTE